MENSSRIWCSKVFTNSVSTLIVNPCLTRASTPTAGPTDAIASCNGPARLQTVQLVLNKSAACQPDGLALGAEHQALDRHWLVLRTTGHSALCTDRLVSGNWSKERYGIMRIR